MSLITLIKDSIFAKKPTQIIQLDVTGAELTATQGTRLQPDLIEAESHMYEWALTDNPIESGAVVTDHIVAKPRTLTLRGVVTDTPLSVFDAVSRLREGMPHTERALNYFKKLYKDKPLLKIVTQLDTYSNMVITSLSIDRTPANISAMTFSATFREVQIVSSQIDTSAIVNPQAEQRDVRPDTGIPSETQSAGKQTTSATSLGSDPNATTATNALEGLLGRTVGL